MVVVIEDSLQRQQAVQSDISCIVSAPAGSGKTTLLCLRIIRLLSVVEQPESILALTFTRKAAAEMRHRTIKMLLEPLSYSVEVQEAVLACRHKVFNVWKLHLQQDRLKIMTLDAFNQLLLSKMPLAKSANIKLEESSFYLYKLVVQNIFDDYLLFNNKDSPLANFWKHFLIEPHKLKLMLESMLASRDIWVWSIYHDAKKQHNFFIDILSHHLHLLDINLDKKILVIANQLGVIEGDFTINMAINLAKWLLTKQLNYKKRFTVKEGVVSKDIKQEILDILEGTSMQKSLVYLRFFLSLADIDFELSNADIRIYDIWLDLLKHLIATFNLYCEKYNIGDYSQVMYSVLENLGSVDEPCDLKLFLNTRVSHLLVDEFQDTSLMQFKLLEHLVYGFKFDNMGKTVFLVGDPMQAIYGFRGAVPELFHHVQKNGIAGLELLNISLSSNFRSIDILLPIFNDCSKFYNDMNSKVSLQRIKCTKQGEGAIIVNKAKTFDIEAENIVNFIGEYKLKKPEDSVAILVRNRLHAQVIQSLLLEKKFLVNADAMSTLMDKIFIKDFINLLLAIVDLDDIKSWLAIIRGPYLGFTLHDLSLLINLYDQNKGNYENFALFFLNFQAKTLNLSQEMQLLMENLQGWLKLSLAQFGRLAIGYLVYELWQNLGGLSLIKNAHEHGLIKQVVGIINSYSKNGIVEVSALLDRLKSATVSDSENSLKAVTIMTMHHAKGLEFDCVVLPRLDASMINDKETVIRYVSLQFMGVFESLFTLNSNSQQPFFWQKIYKCASDIYKLYQYHEHVRLLYVALTRAKCTLYLSAVIDKTEPSKYSHWHVLTQFKNLGSYWSNLESVVIKSADISNSILVNRDYQYRVKLHSNISVKQKDIDVNLSNFNVLPVFWHNRLVANSSSKIGILVHKLLYIAAEYGVDCALMNINQNRDRLFNDYNISDKSGCDLYFDRLSDLLVNDLLLKWILQSKPWSQNEWSLVYKNKKLVIDRIFLQDRIYWIIDYKIATSLDSLMYREYVNQLYNYKKAFVSLIRPKYKVRTALYFPFIDKFCLV